MSVILFVILDVTSSTKPDVELKMSGSGFALPFTDALVLIIWIFQTLFVKFSLKVTVGNDETYASEEDILVRPELSIIET